MKTLLAFFALVAAAGAVPPMDSFEMNPPATSYLLQTFESGYLDDFSCDANSPTLSPWGSPLGLPSLAMEDGRSCARFDQVNGVSADGLKVAWDTDPLAASSWVTMVVVWKAVGHGAYNAAQLGYMSVSGDALAAFRVQLGDMNSDANHYAYPILSDSTYQTLVRAPGQTGVGASLNEWHMATTVCNADSGNMSLDAWREGQSEYHGAEDFRTSYASDWTPGYASYFSQIRTPYSTYTYNNSFDGFVDFVLYMNEVISDARRLEIWELHKAGEL